MDDFMSGLFIFLSHIQAIKEKNFQCCDIIFCDALEFHPRFLES